jgi:hypothetical protein
MCCRTLNLKELIDKLQQVIQKGIEEGSLEVITLLGLRSPLVPAVLQNYVDSTGDIQTAAFIACYSLVMRGKPDDRSAGTTILKRLMQEYRVFLNTLELWYARAEFDVAFSQLSKVPAFIKASESFTGQQMEMVPIEAKDGENADLFETFEDVTKQYKHGFSPDPTDKRPLSLAARCFHCQASFLLESQVKKFLTSTKVPNLAQSQQNVKLISKNCQCGKSIPACAVCLVPTGVINYQVELQKSRTTDMNAQGLKMPQSSTATSNIIMRRDLEMWFLWCQKCKHGGHAQHILEWFVKDGHQECPVSDCECHCT